MKKFETSIVSIIKLPYLPTVIGVVIINAAWYYMVEFIKMTDFVELDSSVNMYIQYGGMGLISIFSLFETVVKWLNKLKAMSIQRRIDLAVAEFKKQTPDKNEMDILLGGFEASLNEGRSNNEQVKRLIEQRKEQLLIDDEYYKTELNQLVVSYLQPLPRNAKRLMNRFSFSLLIASKRGLLTTEPKISGKQIGKWLVLTERWPQLGRSISSTPAKMKYLEEQAKGCGELDGHAALPEFFVNTIHSIAPLYKSDVDLCRFIASEPALGEIVERLVKEGGV